MMSNKVLKALSFTLAMLLACVCFTGCGYEGNGLLGDLIEDDTSVQIGDYHTIQMHVSLDYGNFRQDVATPLLDSCTTEFLDVQKWKLDVFLPGDVYVIKHKGEIMMQESYPGRVVIQEDQLISVARIDAGIIEAQATGTQELEVITEGFVITDMQVGVVVVDEDGHFMLLSDYPVGETLYCTYEQDRALTNQDGILEVKILALYAYPPR